MTKHPLDKAFDVPNDRLVDDLYEDIHIPDDPTLDTIISLSLRAYKEQMEDIITIDPKSRARLLEVAEKFLGQAKDAMAKKEHIALQREKNKGTPAPAASTGTSSAGADTTQPTVSRKELLERMKSVN